MKVLAIDIGSSKLTLGLFGAGGEELDKVSIALSADSTQRSIIRAINEGTAQMDLKDVASAGVTIPGLADTEKGIWVLATFTGIEDFPIVEELTKVLNIPVFLENDVNACALAEKRFGACKDIDNYIWITVGSGIGSSLVLEGCLYKGFSGHAGEIGHFTIEEADGYPCGCGNIGCLDAQAAGPAIARYYEGFTGNKIEGRTKEVGELARGGDRNAIAAFEKAGYYIGKALAYTVNIINPEAVIFGGGVMMDSELILPIIKQVYSKYSLTIANENLSIIKTILGYDATLLGAASVALIGIE
ncbi:MAG: ROK family protein [Oscillospiraceae bacterium]|nr:ROK family protein [Oscillospiraceae bacterium]